MIFITKINCSFPNITEFIKASHIAHRFCSNMHTSVHIRIKQMCYAYSDFYSENTKEGLGESW